jgi:hypothetical protein
MPLNKKARLVRRLQMRRDLLPHAGFWTVWFGGHKIFWCLSNCVMALFAFY